MDARPARLRGQSGIGLRPSTGYRSVGSLTFLHPALARSMKHFLILFLSCLTSAAAVSAQSLTVQHADGREVTLTAAQLDGLPGVAGETTFHDDRVRYEGVDLRDVLGLAGVSPVDSLRGPLLRRVVLVEAADGYAAVIALADLDRSIGARSVVLVRREDGAALPPERGPFRIIVVGDRRPSRAVRQVVRVRVLDVR